MRSKHLSILVFLFVSALVGSFFACRSAASATGQVAGTVITNVATFTYTGSATLVFNGTSNTISITVQNAPTMAVVPPAGINVTPGYTGVDTFQFQNTGNSAGIFLLTGPVTFTGSVTPIGLSYIVAGSTCTLASPCATYTLANTAITALGTTAISGTLNVSVEYQVPTSAIGGTVIPLISPQINYASGTLLNSTNSPTATYTAYTDTVIVDARLDVKVTAAIVSTTNINWTVTANDGGGYPAQGLASAKALLTGATTNGIALFMAVPTFAGNAGQPQTLTATPAPPTLSSGVTTISTTASWYYNATACTSAIASGWSATFNASAKCLAVFLTNATPGTILPLNGGTSAGAGSVSVPAVTAIFSTTQPSGGTGAGNLGAVNLVASSAIGGDPWMSSGAPLPIVGAPLLVDASFDSTSATALNTIVGTATPSSGIIAPGGASNQAQSNAATAASIFVGPNGQAQASGAWSTATVPGYTLTGSTINNDFTFMDYDTTPPSINSATAAPPTPAVGSTIANGGAASIIGTVLNNGNAVDTITLSSTSNSNWTVAYYQSDCSTALGSNQITSLASGATFNFCTKFTPSSTVTSLSAIAWQITGASANGATPNSTWDVLYPGGVIVAFRTYAVSGCPGGTPPNNGIVSGCTVTYTAYFVNEAPLATAFSGLGNATVTPTTAVSVTENGSAVGSWGNLTGGLTVIPTVTNCASCIFTTAGLTSKTFTVSIPLADLPPQGEVYYSYAVLEN